MSPLKLLLLAEQMSLKFNLMLGKLGNNFSRLLFELLLLFFPGNRIRHFMQFFSKGDNLHVMSNSIFWVDEKNLTACRLLNFLRE